MNKDCKANNDEKMDCNDDCISDWIGKTKEYKNAFGRKKK
jgi:hypothetical protein